MPVCCHAKSIVHSVFDWIYALGDYENIEKIKLTFVRVNASGQLHGQRHLNKNILLGQMHGQRQLHLGLLNSSVQCAVCAEWGAVVPFAHSNEQDIDENSSLFTYMATFEHAHCTQVHMYVVRKYIQLLVIAWAGEGIAVVTWGVRQLILR